MKKKGTYYPSVITNFETEKDLLQVEIKAARAILNKLEDKKDILLLKEFQEKTKELAGKCFRFSRLHPKRIIYLHLKSITQSQVTMDLAVDKLFGNGFEIDFNKKCSLKNFKEMRFKLEKHFQLTKKTWETKVNELLQAYK